MHIRSVLAIVLAALSSPHALAQEMECNCARIVGQCAAGGRILSQTEEYVPHIHHKPRIVFKLQINAYPAECANVQVAVQGSLGFFGEGADGDMDGYSLYRRLLKGDSVIVTDYAVVNPDQTSQRMKETGLFQRCTLCEVVKKKKEETVKKAEPPDFDHEINQAVSNATTSMSQTWENSLAGRAANLSAQISQGLRNAKARNAPGYIREFLMNALFLAQAASSRDDAASFACAQEFLDGSPSTACQTMSQKYRGGSAGGADASGCDDAVVSRTSDILSSCGAGGSVCDIARAEAACMDRAIAAAGSCQAVISHAQYVKRSALNTAASVCVR